MAKFLGCQKCVVVVVRAETSVETEWNVRAIKNEENLRNVDGG